MKFELQTGEWLHKPAHYSVTEYKVEIITEPGTDFWQRSYYGFQNENAPAYLFSSRENFSFSARAQFEYQKQFDQCGFIIYLDSENWFKVSIEFENSDFSRLGSVVTNSGYSDWATSDISLPSEIWYRLSRRGPDFLIEYALEGSVFKQMRIFHLHALEETSAEMGKADPPLPAGDDIHFGVYACSPSDSSFTARFSHFRFESCLWKAHGSV